MTKTMKLSALCILLLFAGAASANAQNLEIKRYNASEWTKGRFSDAITVTGPGKTIYLSGVGAEDENATGAGLAPVRHPGNFYEQCKYAFD